MRSELQVWQRFIQTHSHVLNLRASALFQQALNQPDNSAIAISAEMRLDNQVVKPLWLRLVNKPVDESSCIRTLAGHAGPVFGCAFSPDGKRIASASYDHTLKMWDARTGEQLFTMGETESVIICAFSPCGNFLVSIASGEHQKVGFRVWDTLTGENIAAHGEPNTLLMCACAYSPDGKRLAMSSSDGKLSIWDTDTWRCLITLAGHKGRVETCAYSPDGSRIVSGGGDWNTYGEIKVWDANNGKELAHIDGHEQIVFSCAFSPDGKHIVSGSNDHTIKVWDSNDYHELATLTSHTAAVRNCSYSPDGSRFASASWDNTLIIWNAQTFAEVQRLVGHKLWVNSASWTPDGNYLVSASHDHTVKIWDCNNAAVASPRATYPGIIVGLEYSPDANQLAAAVDNDLLLLDADTLEKTTNLKGHTKLVSGCAWSAAGERLLSSAYDASWKQWETSSGREVMTVTTEKELSNCLYSPDSRRILAASHDKSLRLWDAESGIELATFVGHGAFILKAGDFSPDGRQILSAGGNDNTLRVWDAETAELKLLLSGHNKWVDCGRYSPDGRLIASASWDHTLKVWDGRTAKVLATLAPGSGTISTCAYSLDGQTIIAASHKALHLWNAQTFEEQGAYFTEGSVYSIALRLHGQPIACGDSGGAISLIAIENRPLGVPIVTAVYAYRTSLPTRPAANGRLNGEWDDKATARCHWCGHRFIPLQRVVDAIQGIGNAAQLTTSDSPCLNLPDEAWDEPQLLSECQVCKKSVKFNPFIVDNRDGSVTLD